MAYWWKRCQDILQVVLVSGHVYFSIEKFSYKFSYTVITDLSYGTNYHLIYFCFYLIIARLSGGIAFVTGTENPFVW
jgi:hypothetical protein